jgi:hypothetical protein
MAATSRPSLKKRVAGMKRILAGKLYYVLTITATEDGEVVWDTQSRWAGWVDDECRFEYRVARPVCGDRFADSWKSADKTFLIVNNEPDLYLFLFIGGDGLIEESVAKNHLPELLKPEPSARSGRAGFVSLNNLPASQLKHAPTPKQRMKIIKRDNYRCRICGRRPADYVDVEIHVHHIRPWARGGLTEDANLITLCHTCHKGLDPHEDHNLYDFIQESGPNRGREEGQEEFKAAVARYQAIMGESELDVGISRGNAEDA